MDNVKRRILPHSHPTIDRLLRHPALTHDVAESGLFAGNARFGR